MKISVLQMNLRLGELSANLSTLRRLMDAAMESRPDVVVLPELWNIGFYPTPIRDYAKSSEESSLRALSELSRTHQVNIVGGTIATTGAKGICNTCHVFDREGTLIAAYDKTHLFSPMKEDEDFTPGSRIVTFRIEGIRCAVAVCYDIRFPELIRKLALAGIDVLFLPAEWPMERLIHWQTLIRARAIENQIFLIAANGAGSFPEGMTLAGHSAIIDPWGEILAEAKEEETILHANLRPVIRRQIKEHMDVFSDRRPELYELPVTH